MAHEDLNKESEGNVRYLAGWALWKEIKACERYVSKCGRSTTASVKDRVAKEKSLQSILMQFRATIANLESSSLFPSSLHHTENLNRGGLQHVSDEFFIFFVTVEQVSRQHFRPEYLDKYGFEAVSEARKLTREDPVIQIAFRNLQISHAGKRQFSVNVVFRVGRNSQNQNHSAFHIYSIEK